MKRPLRLLVIGGVAAGTKAASKARREDPLMEITIITDEKYISYAGCGLAYYIGGVVKKIDEQLGDKASCGEWHLDSTQTIFVVHFGNVT